MPRRSSLLGLVIRLTPST